MKHGEIRWYKFIKPDKKRPALILTRDSVLEYLGEITIAPIISTIRNIPSKRKLQMLTKNVFAAAWIFGKNNQVTNIIALIF